MLNLGIRDRVSKIAKLHDILKQVPGSEVDVTAENLTSVRQQIEDFFSQYGPWCEEYERTGRFFVRSDRRSVKIRTISQNESDITFYFDTEVEHLSGIKHIGLDRQDTFSVIGDNPAIYLSRIMDPHKDPSARSATLYLPSQFNSKN